MAVQREQIVQTAEKYVSRGKIEPAIREYRKLLAENPNDINTLNRIGDLYARIQRIDEAVDFFTQIAEQYSTEGFFVKAIAIYKKIIKLDPTRLEVYEKLAELYHRQGLVNEARTQYQVLADYYQKHDNAASAIAIYQKMADLEPNNPSYHVKLAEIYQSQQLIEKAMNEYRVIAEMMMAHGRSQDAGQVYERALDIDSSNMAFISDAFLRLRDSGNVAAATRFLAFASERNPQAARLGRGGAAIAEPELPAPTPTPMPPPMPAPVEPRQAPPAAPVAPSPPRPVEQRAPLPEPEPEPEIPYGSSFADQDDWDQDELAAALRAAAAATAPPMPEAPAAEPEEEPEIELDLDEGFVLDMDADDEPASLVKPPPDMLAGPSSRLGSAWSRGDETGAAPPAPPGLTTGFPAGLPADLPADQGTGEFELDLGELGELPTGPFKEVQLPADEAILLELEQPELSPIDPGIWAVEQELPPLELDDALPAAPLPGMPGMPTPEPGLDTDLLERTAAELHAPSIAARDEDLVSEAEVLAKYGLEDKALERLREALRIRPQNLGAYATMIEIHLAKGAHERVVELANIMSGIASGIASRIAAGPGGAALWAKTRRHLVEAGYRLDGDHVQAGPGAFLEPAPAPAPPAPVAAAAPAPPAEPPVVEPVPAAPPPPPPPPMAAPPPAAPAPAAPPRKRPAGDIDQMLRGLIEPRAKRPAAPASAPPLVSPPAIPPPPPPPAAPPPPALAAAAEPEPSAPPRPVMFNPLEIGAMIESEDLDWEPSGAGSGFAAPSPQTPQAPARSLPSLDDTGGLSWLDEAEKNRPGKLAEAGTAEARSVFDEEDDFFDLAAELEQELSGEDIFPAGDVVSQPAEQSLEEIVEGFKKGVAEHLSPTDYDTHFNLGIAYREMGLLDEAIGEFQVAAKDAGHLVLCCSMLGLCFLDKGLPELAVKWYRRGLEAPELSEEDHLGLLYDLGCAYLAVDDKASAYKAFVDLYGINNGYRDVVARIEELGR
jgi:tetratricopeptide (TPR) repeat protein